MEPDETALTLPEPRTDVTETASVAREMAQGYRRLVESYRRDLHLSAAEAIREADAGSLALVRAGSAEGRDPRDLAWWELGKLGDTSPEAMHEAWSIIKAEARDELATGHRAAMAQEWEGRPWDRAQFLALRDSFREEWQPRGGIEDTLIDTLAMAQSAVLHWTVIVTTRAAGEALTSARTLRDAGRWEPPRLEAAEAVEQAAAMVDRYNRLFLRTLRALRDLRRHAPPVVIQNAGQLSVGGQQVNVVAGSGGQGDVGATTDA